MAGISSPQSCFPVVPGSSPRKRCLTCSPTPVSPSSSPQPQDRWPRSGLERPHPCSCPSRESQCPSKPVHITEISPGSQHVLRKCTPLLILDHHLWVPLKLLRLRVLQLVSFTADVERMDASYSNHLSSWCVAASISPSFSWIVGSVSGPCLSLRISLCLSRKPFLALPFFIISNSIQEARS